jgi:heat shock protein HslJ
MKSTNKKTSLFFYLLLVLICISSCTQSNHKTYWVDSVKRNCESGAGKMMCLNIYEGENLDSAQWELFYSNISGFTFEPGYYQKIVVSSEILVKEKIPADGSAISYTLEKVLEKKEDKKIRLHDIWAAKSILGNPIPDSATMVTPTLEINLSKMEITGSNGCNNYRGSIEKINDSLLKFSMLLSTKKMCMNMMISDLFDNALNQTFNYQLKNTTLTFYDIHENELITFQKID